ncbi:MAG TPA: toll/interleukin-1 receptor domain-containing protein, partial [Roseiarcus sp.]|nr:toll/interleukin-1 receptor domain-containing protein [Roseiarcus sp.]
MVEPVDIKYCAFLSYAHNDSRWAQWLHRRLESVRVDRDLVGRHTQRGTVPRVVSPVFRDRYDFVGGHELKEETVDAIDGSANLIVLCSSVAAMRPAVNEEVRLFR